MSTREQASQRQGKGAAFSAIAGTVLAALGGIVLGLAAYITRGSAIVPIVCGSASVSLVGLASAIQMSRDQGLFGSLAAGQLGSWFATSSAVVFGLASLIWISPPAPYGSLISKDSILSAMFVAAVAVVLFAVGYLMAPRRPVLGGAGWLRRVVITERPVRPGQGTAWLLLGIAFTAYLGQIAIGRFGYLSNPATAVSSGNPFAQFLFVVGNFSLFAVALSAYDYAHRGGRRQLLSFASLLTVASIAGAFSGNKEIVALGFIAALLGYVVGGRRIPIAWLAAAVLVFIFVVVPFTTTFRSEVAAGNSRLSPVQVLQSVSKQGLAFFVPAQGQSPALQTLQRISRVGDVAITLQRSKPSDIAYRPLTELLEAPLLGVVPRLVWPGKPILDTGYQFSKQYYGFPASQYSASAITPEGDLWRHGGWPVLIFGMMLFGAGVRMLDTAALGGRNAPIGLFSVLTFFPVIVKHEMDAVLMLASIPSLMVGIALAARIATLRRAKQASSQNGALPNVVVVVNQPIQHFSESFRRVAQSSVVRVSVLYWADHSGATFDHEFNRHISWDADLLSGYRSVHAEGATPLTRALSFVRSLRALKPDVVVCFGWASAAARLTIPWCLVTRTPILFYGDTSWQQVSRGPRQWLRSVLLRIAFWLSNGAVSTGTFNREFYIRQGMHPSRIVDSVYPIDVEPFATARRLRSAEGDKVIIGFAGKLIARKGVDELLRALQIISDDDTWHARIVGEGEERERLVAMSESLGIAARVDFVGFRNTSAMPSELARFDIGVVPSVQDNRGMIAAEAMAAGAVAIVSTGTGVWGRGDLVEDGLTGRVYRSGNPAELAATLRELLRNPDLMASLRRRGAIRAAEHGPDAFARALEQAAVNLAAHE